MDASRKHARGIAEGNDDAIVELGGYRVRLSLLRQPGVTRDQIRREMGFFYEVTRIDKWRRFPLHGWRLIHENLAERVYAVPDVGDQTTWSLVHLVLRNGVYRLAGARTGVRPQRPRARADSWLSLSWPGVQRQRAGTVPKLSILLENTGLSALSVPSPSELRVVAWLVDLESGRALPASRRVPFPPAPRKRPPRVQLESQQVLQLWVGLATIAPERLSAGRYGVRAYCSYLDLSATEGLIELE